MTQVATVTFGDFEWDDDKAAANAAKHGVTFEEAVTVFLDLDYLLVRDSSSPSASWLSGCPVRHGSSSSCTANGARGCAIISARRATRRERETYERRRESD